MVPVFSSTIRRKEMDAVLSCLVDEKVGPGEMNAKLVSAVKDFFGVAGGVAFRSPEIALSYALKSLGVEKTSKIMISALAPGWQYSAVREMGFVPLVLDVDESSGLVSADAVQKGIQSGGSVLILHETMGILPDSDEMERILDFGIFVIEDISQAVGAGIFKDGLGGDDSVADGIRDDDVQEESSIRRAGTFGVFAILGLEENDCVTGGGGAVLLAPSRRDWLVLKKISESASRTEILGDLNSALAFVQLKEFSRNEAARKSIFSFYKKAFPSSSKNRLLSHGQGVERSVWSFPVVLAGNFPDAEQYAKRKDVSIAHAYSDSVIARILREESELDESGTPSDVNLELLSNMLIRSKSLYLRTALFPLYPRMNSETVSKITKIMATLP